jgi:hypothetical protein
MVGARCTRFLCWGAMKNCAQTPRTDAHICTHSLGARSFLFLFLPPPFSPVPSSEAAVSDTHAGANLRHKTHTYDKCKDDGEPEERQGDNPIRVPAFRRVNRSTGDCEAGSKKRTQCCGAKIVARATFMPHSLGRAGPAPGLGGLA